ncbi:MAG: DUF222 domain-containing protein [Actinomycetes bacterium]
MFAPPLPEPLKTVLNEVRAWGDATSPAGPGSAADGQNRLAWLAGLRQLVDATESVYLEALDAVDSAGDVQSLHGARSTSSWLKGALHLAPGAASSHVKMARVSRHTLAHSLKDVRDGTMTMGHLAAIEGSLRRIPPEVTTEAAEVLGDLAKLVDVGRLRAAGKTLQHVVDPDGAFSNAQKQHDRRYLHLSPLLDGMVALDGLLDAEGAAALDAALAPFLVPSGDHDLRTSPQRRADGLIDLARSAMTNDPTTLGGQPVQLQVLVPAASLIESTQSGSTQSGTTRTPSAGGVPRLGPSPCQSTALTPQAFERLGCDASVARLVFGPGGIPLDLGRSQRLFSPTQRRALAYRDGGCRFPGCSRPPRFTDAHHIVPWSRGGASDVSNALLLCRYHHRLVHEGGWSIVGTRTPDDDGGQPGLDFLGPDGQQLTGSPRAP